MSRTRIVAATAVLCVAALHSLSAQDWEDVRHYRGDGVHVRVGKSYYLPADQVATTSVMVVGGSATIDGRLEGNLMVMGGHVRIGPAAKIYGEVVGIGGGVEVADTAEVRDEIHNIDVMWPEIRFALRDWFWGVDSRGWTVFAMVGTALRFTLTMLASCFLALVAPGWLRRIQGKTSDSPIAVTLMGFAAEVLFVPALVFVIAALVLTVVGIPLLILVPFVVLFFILLWIAGFASVAAHIGGAIRFRTGMATDSPVIDAAWGVMVLFLVTFIGNILAFGPWPLRPVSLALNTAGFLIEYFAWTVGLGAALLAPFTRRLGSAPPPIPSTATVHA